MQTIYSFHKNVASQMSRSLANATRHAPSKQMMKSWPDEIWQVFTKSFIVRVRFTQPSEVKRVDQDLSSCIFMN